MATLTVKNLSLQYPNTAQATLNDITFEIAERKITVVLGHSGSGKTTLLQCMAGFITTYSGKILLNDKIYTKPNGKIAVVFQDDALLPWFNVCNNIEISLKLQNIPKNQRKSLVTNILNIVGLTKVANKAIWEISGGQKQRVGIARALVSSADIILMDEPFASLDAITREQMQEFVLQLWKQSNKSFFLITHDIDEALILATDLILLSGSPGQITKQIKLQFNSLYLDKTDIKTIKQDKNFLNIKQEIYNFLVNK